MKNNFEFPEELSKNIGLISLHFQRLQYVVFEFVVWLLGDSKSVKKEICEYNFNRLVTLMNLLIKKELSKFNSLKQEYKNVYSIIKNVQKLRNNTIHSSFIVTYSNRELNIRYNIKDVVSKGVKSIKKINKSELEKLINLTKKTVTDLSDFSHKFKALNSNII